MEQMPIAAAAFAKVNKLWAKALVELCGNEPACDLHALAHGHKHTHAHGSPKPISRLHTTAKRLVSNTQEMKEALAATAKALDRLIRQLHSDFNNQVNPKTLKP
jgi:hypothetical protein